MKRKNLVIVLSVVFGLTLTACGENAANTEGIVESTQTPVIVFGDENLSEEMTEENMTTETSEALTESAEEGTTQDLPTESETAETDTQEGSYVTGAYLGLGNAPRDATLKESTSYVDGGYIEVLSCEEDKVFIHIEKELLSDGAVTLESVQSRMETERGWLDTTGLESEELSENIGYPVYHYQFRTGEGEESNYHDTIYFSDGTFGYLLDCYTEASEYDEYLELMEMWIESAYIGGAEHENI